MKLRITHPRSQVVLTSIALIAISIACSASKSAKSPSVTAANTAASASTDQPLTSSSRSITQNKQPCTLTLSAAPSIHGMRLGMNSDDVLALFPGRKDEPDIRASLSGPRDELGVSSFAVTPSKYTSKDNFVGIRQARFTLLDDRVWKMYVTYDGSEWANIDQAIEKFRAGTSLPAATDWEPYVGMDNLKTLKCPGFEVSIFAGGERGPNYAEVRGLAAEKELNERTERLSAKPTPAVD